VTKHKLRWVAELITDHACIVASVILKRVVLVDDHGRVNIGDLLLILDSIFGKLGTYKMVSSHFGQTYNAATTCSRERAGSRSTDHLASIGPAARQPHGPAAHHSVRSWIDIPPTRALSSTMLKLARQIGQLLALSTQGVRQSLCRLWPHGSKCATISSSLGTMVAFEVDVSG
jgi:hypothetical protein